MTNLTIREQSTVLAVKDILNNWNTTCVEYFFLAGIFFEEVIEAEVIFLSRSS